MRMKTLLAAAAALVLTATGAQAQALRVFVGGAATQPVREAGAEFTRRTGKALDIVSDTTGSLQKRLRAGEKADVVVITAPAVDALQQEKLVLVPGRVDLARGLIGVAVKTGAKAPDLSSEASVKAALLAAKSVSYVDPKAGGTSGAFFEGQMARMGIAEAMKPKVVYRGQGSEVAAAVAAGEAELGITFTSELTPNPGIRVAGTLPAPIQLPTVYTAAVAASTTDLAASQALVDVLKGPAGIAALRKAGLDVLVK
ncbi:MAG TPA: substrate-binding domain-containing protein [Caulobacteraceae bacterium]|jgi:molybdate transport system substrate-binding protein|nr:substrate-binding domain-containing protein [Caulobacteraceae bacterium]